jgi:hypothetical protein
MPKIPSREYRISDCIEWQGPKDRYGYGMKSFQGRTRPAHRAVYCETHGISYKNLRAQVIRHGCDNPGCVNPQHLIAGTHAENSQDMVDRDRSCRGERHYNRKLTEAAVLEARNLYTYNHPEFSCPALALRYGVTKSALWQALIGATWKHLPNRIGDRSRG